MYKRGISFLCNLLSVVLAITIGMLLSKFGVPLGGAGWVLMGLIIRLVLFFAIEDGGRRTKNPCRSLTRKRERTVSMPYVHAAPAPPEKVYLEKPWEFEFVRTDEKMRKQIVEHVRKKYDSRDEPYLHSLNLAYGVMEKTNGVFLTMIYFVSRGIIRTDYKYDLEKYVLLRGDKAYGVERYESLCAPLPYVELAEQAIAYYKNSKETFAFKEKLEAADPELDLHRLRYQLLRQYFGN